MSEPKRPLKVFLCHARDDKVKTRDLYRNLRKRGIQPWLDAEDLVAGQDWRVEIPKAIKASDAIIICLSKNSINKEGFVQAEITFALEKALEIPQGRIFIIPARLEDCEVPNNLERFHWVDLFEEDGFPKLMKSLRTRARQLERVTVEIPQPDETSPILNSVLEEKFESEVALERGEYETVAREKTEKEAAEKARLESEEQARQKAAKVKEESESAERAEKEREEKELLEKQTRESREKAKRVTERKEEKPVAVRLKARGQISFWVVGFVIFVFVIMLSSVLNSLLKNLEITPENSQSNITVTSTYVKTAEPGVTSTQKLAATITPATLGLETDNASVASSDNSKNLYFVSEDKRFGVLNTLTGKSQMLFPLGEFNDYLSSDGVYTGKYSTLSWAGDSNLFVWLVKEALVVNLQSKEKRTIQTIFNYEEGFDTSINSSDVNENGYFILHNNAYWEMPFVLSAGIDGARDEKIIASEREVLMNGYRGLFCMRQRPNDNKVAVVVSDLDGVVLSDPNLALLEVADVNSSPVVIKKQVDGCISWSPDGKYIAYGNGKVRWSGLNNFTKGIFYIDYQTGSVVKVSDSNGYYPVWSPDGASIAFITDQGVSIVDVNTKLERQIYSGDVLALLWGE